MALHRQSPHRAFAPAWLAGERSARDLLGAGFAEKDTRVEAARRAAARRAPAALLDVLADQHRGLPASLARDRHLEMLGAGGAATVVAGQQVALFTGPAFSLYKAAGVVAAARQLSGESGVPCVPIFWLPTEDHDWAEICQTVVRGDGDRAQPIALPDQAAPARVPVAARTFDQSIDIALGDLDAALASKPHGGEVAALLRRHYRIGTSPADAFRGVMSELFAADGLLLLDPRRPEIAERTRPLYERALGDAAELAAGLERRADGIAAAGFHVQVPVRHQAPLAFFHPDGPCGPRYRLEPAAGGWRLCDTERHVTRDEAMQVLREDPMCFSSSALLRPLVQDWLLPNAITLAGPGEIAYLAQAEPLYRAFGVEMPLVAPRPSFCVTGAGDRRRLEALGIGIADVARDRDDLLAQLSRSSGGDTVDPDEVEHLLTKDFQAALDAFAARAIALDPTLTSPIAKTREAVTHAAARLAAKYRRSALDHDAVLVARLDRVREALAPGGVPQERCYGLASLAAEHGIGRLCAAIDRGLEPFEPAMKEIAL